MGAEQDRTLSEEELDPAPMVQFRRWYAEAEAAGEPEVEAMNVATVAASGMPSSRFVLLKSAGEEGFTFYTNYRSRKGSELDARPVAALAFRWGLLDRQVRAAGAVEVVGPEESDAYFASRARRSQLGAWASAQSEVIAGRSVLDDRLAEVEERFAGAEVPRPPWWGGIRMIPAEVEFWQGRANRLHDRFRYRRGTDGWTIDRLSP